MNTPMIIHRLTFLALFLALASAAPAASGQTTATQASAAPAAPALPPTLKWETNTTETLIGDPAALKGGTYNTYMFDYPLTFRLMGPNNNDSFAAWNRAYSMDFSLTMLHPVTDRPIPWMATHWAVMDDHKTIYYKLDPAARWSDGKPVTADDYVFTFQMMGSKEIVDPYYNEYVKNYFERVEAVDPLTVRVVGKRPSWRPLVDYNLFPMPRHAVKLAPDWVKEANNTPQIVAGPYVVTQADTGRKVVFDKVKNWWGENRGYFKGLYNVDRIVVRVIPDERELDYFMRGEIDMIMIRTARIWAEGLNLREIRNGWIHKKRVFVEMPEGINGFSLNLQVPIFQNKDFRKAVQYLFNFDVINRNIMYDSYYRQVSTFTGSEYANPDLKPYGFNPYKAREHLVKAGYTRRNGEGILIDGQGEPASFTLIYGSKGLEPHLIVLQQYYRHFGVDMKLKLLDGGTAFNRVLERKYEATLVGYAARLYPEPYQYFHSDFLKTTNNNNIWYFGRPDTDKLIDTYRFDMDRQARLDAMWKLDAIIQDEAFYVPFWSAPYHRFLYWDRLCWPKNYLPRRTNNPLSDWQVFWIDPAREKRLAEAKKSGKALAPDAVVDEDPWGVKAALEAKEAAAKAAAEKAAAEKAKK